MQQGRAWTVVPVELDFDAEPVALIQQVGRNIERKISTVLDHSQSGPLLGLTTVWFSST
jgi:hypothetical protein